MLHVPHLSSFWMLLFSLLCFPQNTHTFYLHILIIWCLLTKLASWSITKLVQSVSERQNAWVTAHPLTLLRFLPLNLLWILSTPIFCSLILAWEVFFHLFTFNLTFSYPSVQSSRSVVSDSVWLCDPMNRSTPGLPVHHKLPEFTHTHVHRAGDAILPSHPLSSPSPPAPNPSQHQGLFQWVNSSHEVAKVLEFQLPLHCI